MKTLAIIPARGGSKGIPDKNLRCIGGRSLLARAIDAAVGSEFVSRTIVSTDSPRIAEVGRAGGAEVPFLRPPELAGDHSKSIDVVMHALRWCIDADDWTPTCVVLLQPTSPLRTSKHVDQAISLFTAKEPDSVVSVTPLDAHAHPDWQFVVRDDALQLYNGTPLRQIITRRQDLGGTTYTRNGAIYITRAEVLLDQKSLYGDRCLPYVMDRDVSVNIDTLQDLHFAEYLISVRSK